MARDLHDGLAQELAYIKMEARRMAAADPGGRAADWRSRPTRAHGVRGTRSKRLRRRGRSLHLELSELADQLTRAPAPA